MSAVLAVLRLQEALARLGGKGDNVDGDEVVLECARCPGPGAGQERRCGQRVAQAQDELRPRVDGGCYPGQLEGIGQDLVLLRALRRPLVRPALGQDGPAPVGAANLDTFPRRDGDGGWVQLKAEREPRRSSITRSAPRCSAESPAGTAPSATAAGLADAPIPGTAAFAGSGMLPDSRSRSPSHSLTILPSGPCRRRTVPARSSARQIWFTVCRGEMPARAATWSSSRGRAR